VGKHALYLRSKTIPVSCRPTISGHFSIEFFSRFHSGEDESNEFCRSSNNFKLDAVQNESQSCVSTGRLAREWAGGWIKTDQLDRVHSGRISRLYVLRHLQSMFAVEKSLKNQMKSAHTVFPDCRPISDEHNMKFE
jgi:hypothetical protein